VGTLFDGLAREGLLRLQLVALALAASSRPTVTENRLQVFPGRPVRGHDGNGTCTAGLRTDGHGTDGNAGYRCEPRGATVVEGSCVGVA
jgi:hypothetical protein